MTLLNVILKIGKLISETCLEANTDSNFITVCSENEQSVFAFDLVAKSDISQEVFFDKAGRDFLKPCLDGYNRTAIFCGA